jgi:hypothetical protein
MDVLTIQWGWFGGRKFGGVPPAPVPVEAEARIGGGGIVFRYVDALDDDALLISLLGLWMDD